MVKNLHSLMFDYKKESILKSDDKNIFKISCSKCSLKIHLMNHTDNFIWKIDIVSQYLFNEWFYF